MSGALTIQQWESYEGEDWWNWGVWIEGDDQVLDDVEYVEWRLHPTFPTPIHKISDRRTKFRLDTAGWGVFVIVARIHSRNGQDTLLRHQLRLHYHDGTDTTA